MERTHAYLQVALFKEWEKDVLANISVGLCAVRSMASYLLSLIEPMYLV